MDSDKKVQLTREALEVIRDAATRNYRGQRSLYVSIIEALEEYILTKGGKPGFEVTIRDFD